MIDELVQKILNAEKESMKKLQTLQKEIEKQKGLRILTGVNNLQLAPNFNLREFGCKGGDNCCGGAVKFDPELIRRLQKMRDELKAPIRIASGFRCPDYNKRVGGVTNSYHLRGQAVDIKSNVPMERLYALAEKYFEDGGIGKYETFVHVDTGTKRRWFG